MGLLSTVATGLTTLARRLDAPAAYPIAEMQAVRVDLGGAGAGGAGGAVRVDAGDGKRTDAARADCASGDCFSGGLWSDGGVGMNDDEIENLCRSQLMYRIVTLLPSDAMKLDPDLSGPTLGELGDVWDYLQTRLWPDAEAKALFYSRMYGGGAVALIVDDGRTLDQPIDLFNVRDIVGMLPVRKRFITPGFASSVARAGWWGQQWGNASHYVVTPWTGEVDLPDAGEVNAALGAAGLDYRSPSVQAGLSRVHPSRVIAYPYRQWYDWLQARRFTQWKGWGPGVVETVADAFLTRVKGIQRTGDIVNSFGYDWLKMPGLHDMLASPAGPNRFRNFISWIKQCRDMTGDGVPFIATGPDVEKIETMSRSVAGLADLIEAQRSFLLDVCEYPRIAIFGAGSGGLSGKDEGEWQTHYQLVSSYNQRVRWPGIRHAAIVAMAARNGPTKGRIDFRITAAWGSLAEERNTDRSEARKRDSEAREKDAAILGLDPRTLIRLDNTLEDAYPGIQAELENGTILPVAPTAAPAPGSPSPTALPSGGGPSAAAAEASVMPGTGSGVDSTVPMASQGLADEVAAPAPAPAPAAIPTDLITEPEARRMLRCGAGTFARWVREGKLRQINTGAGRRYSMAEVVACAMPPVDDPLDVEPDSEEKRDGERMDAGRMDPLPHEHAARQQSQKGFSNFSRQAIAEGVTLILGIRNGKSQTQSVRFSSKVWSPSEAKAWLREHGYKAGAFESAVGGRSDLDAKRDAEALCEG